MKKKMLTGLGIGIALLASLGWTLENQGIEAETSEVSRGDIQKYAEDIGEIKCKDSTTVYLEGSGRILAIPAEENQPVKKGDLLLAMDREQLGIAYQNMEESYQESLAQVSAGKETYMTAVKDYNNTKLLAEQGAVSQWELTQKETALNSAKAVYSGYQAQLSQAELNRQNGLISLNKQQLVSPIDGTILERKVKLNEIGAPGTAAFVIGDPQNIEIEVKILAEDVTGIEAGCRAEITCRAENKEVMEGIVTKVAPTATEEVSSLGVKQKKVSVTVRPVEPSESLKPGAETDVKVITAEKSNTVVVPVGAVFDYDGKNSVFVVEDGKAVIRTIKTGIRNKSCVEILGGVKVGEVILSAPDNTVEIGSRIKTKR